MLQTTLCYLEKEGRYLMLHRVKKESDVNAGKWIGVGGKFERGEAPEDCLIREVFEETGIIPVGFGYRGLITFIYAAKEPEYIFTYTATELAPVTELGSRILSAVGTDEEIEMEEGILRWVPKEDALSLNLWEGDKYMLEYLLQNRSSNFSLKLVYDAEDNLTEAYELSQGVTKLK